MTWGVPRKPPGREATCRDRADESRGAELGVEWAQRYIALRRRGLLMPLLKSTEDGSSWFVATNMSDLWGSAELVSVVALRARIESAEAEEKLKEAAA